MALVFIVAGVVWGMGAMMRVPQKKRLFALGGLYVLVLLVQLILPTTASLRIATGGSLGKWLIFGAVVVLVLAYRALVQRLHQRAKAMPPPQKTPQTPNRFSETELDRYARHIVLHEIGGAGQKKLKAARVLVVGAGGLGAPALQYLAAAGVGTIGVIDDDHVDNSNLQRQVIHTDAAIGMPKVQSACDAMLAQNPHINVKPYARRLTQDIAADLIADYDLVLDGTDNFNTRYLVNKICVDAGKPLISAALTQWEGQISTYDPAHGAPCYQCIFPQAPSAELAPSCAGAGVLGPLPGVLGAMMAVEAVKELTGAGTGLKGQLYIYDALYGESRKIALKRRADCPVCGE